MAHQAAKRIRINGLQGFIPMPGLPGTIRLFQMSLTTINRKLSVNINQDVIHHF